MHFSIACLFPLPTTFRADHRYKHVSLLPANCKARYCREFKLERVSCSRINILHKGITHTLPSE